MAQPQTQAQAKAPAAPAKAPDPKTAVAPIPPPPLQREPKYLKYTPQILAASIEKKKNRRAKLQTQLERLDGKIQVREARLKHLVKPN